MIIDIGDYLSATLLIMGYFIAGRKNKWGWFLSLFGNIGYIFVSFFVGLYGNMILGGIMSIICIVNFLKWNKNEK
jgi:nicotinamide riboside transporter PnuC